MEYTSLEIARILHGQVEGDQNIIIESVSTIEDGKKGDLCFLSNPKYNISAASMNVKVGSLSDPDDAQGLAHFLEHMLFMGTSKFPDENHFEARLDTLGGSYNAYTDSENTVYHFEVFNNGFEEILDIFSRFFVTKY